MVNINNAPPADQLETIHRDNLMDIDEVKKQKDYTPDPTTQPVNTLQKADVTISTGITSSNVNNQQLKAQLS